MTVLHPEWTMGRLPVPDWCPVPILQDRGEWERFHRFAADLQRTSVLEIGALYGGTLWYWAVLSRVRRIVSVDRIVSPDDSRYEQVVECRAMWPRWMRGIDFHDIVGDSTDPNVVARVEGLGPFDVVFVDGDHSAEVVRSDWNHYSPMVRPGGVVAFHDSAGIGAVTELVNELRADHETVDFRAPSSDLGITVAFMP